MVCPACPGLLWTGEIRPALGLAFARNAANMVPMPATPSAVILSAMKAVPMFSQLPQSALAKLAAQCRTMHLKPAAMIFGPTQPAEQFFIVMRGQAKIYKLSARGDEQILHLYGRGETFGEAAMLAGIDYPAYAQALEQTDLLAVSRSVLRRAIHDSPELAMGMLAGLSAKLREFNRLIEELSLKEVPARLAGVILKQAAAAASPRIRLTQTKRQLAAQIGTIAETLSRALGKMKSDGLIGVRGSEIEILDRGALEELALNG